MEYFSFFNFEMIPKRIFFQGVVPDSWGVIFRHHSPGTAAGGGGTMAIRDYLRRRYGTQR